MIKAKRAGFSYEEYVEMAHIINNYVLPKGLNEDELNTAIRPEEWDNLQIGEDNEKTLLLGMAKDVIEYWNCIWANRQMAFFNQTENRYDTRDVMLRGYLQEKYQYDNISTPRIEEVLKQVNIQLQTKQIYWKERSKEYILCDNKLVSIKNDDVINNTMDIYTDIYYPYSIMSKEEFDNFNGRAKSFIEEISCYDKEKNPDIIKIIWESIGCMLSPIKPFGKIFIFYGSGNNGKSLLLKVIKKIMGDFMTHANILTINDKFALEPVIKGICNVTDDVGITTLKESGNLKTLIQGGSIEVNRKFKDSIWWESNSQFVICCNEIPRIQDTTKGMTRRLAFIPFEMQLADEDVDINLENILINDIDNLRYILTGGIFAFRKALSQKYLTQTKSQEDLMNDFLEENKSPIDLFFDYLLQQEGDNNLDKLCMWLNGKTTDEIYSLYKDYRISDKDIEIQKTFTGRFKRKLPTNKIELVRHSLSGVSFTSYTLKK